ncbi:plasmid mobilization protein [Aeromonas caviae]
MIKRQRWGRPPKIDSDKRTLRVRVSFTADEYQKLQARCHASGVAKISELVRAIALNEKHIDSEPAIRHVELIHWLGKVRTSIPRTKNENFSHLISMGYH